MNVTEGNKYIKIDLSIGDQLTTISCGHVVVELIKFIAYQRLQIPYTYQWLKDVINKRKLWEDVRESHVSERHFYVASTALENLDFILKSVIKEIDGASIPDEICIVLGATPITCKEVYRLILPNACHKRQCHSSHIASDQKIKRNVFMHLVTSEKLSSVFFSALAPTNMYVFVKKSVMNNEEVTCSDNFILANSYKIPRSSKVVVLDFRTQNLDKVSCCNNFNIFGEVSKNLAHPRDNDSEDDFGEIESTDEVRWFQSSYVMKGFKDSVVDGKSVTNAWLQS